MKTILNRRQWLKASTIAAAGLTLAPPARALRWAESSFSGSQGSPDYVWLDQNENPFGISPRAEQAIGDQIKYSPRYPDETLRELQQLIAEREGLTPDHVILGVGSTEVFSITGMVYTMDGGEVLMADPSYFGFRRFVERIGGKVHLVPLNDRFEHDLDALNRALSREISMVYICNPNNPTGTIVDGSKLHSFCEDAQRRTLVAVDEAYNELVDDQRYSSMVDLVKKDLNVIIFHTFSKVYGLAGLRVGYGLAKPDIIKKLTQFRTTYAPVGTLSARAAIESYKDTEFVKYVQKKNAESRSYFANEVERLGYFHIPSHTNFVIFRINRDSQKFANEFRAHMVRVRPMPFHDKNWCRVSMGTITEMKKAIEVLEKIT